MKRLSFFIAVLAVVFTSCRRNQVSLVQHNFGEEVEQQQNLVFTFDKDLAPDSLQNVWDSTEYVRFEPKVDGKFRWNNARELVFSFNGLRAQYRLQGYDYRRRFKVERPVWFGG